MSYSEKIEEELRFFQDVTNVHEPPSIYHYWSSKYLQSNCDLLGFSNPDEFYIRHISRIARSAPESNPKGSRPYASPNSDHLSDLLDRAIFYESRCLTDGPTEATIR